MTQFSAQYCFSRLRLLHFFIGLIESVKVPITESELLQRTKIHNRQNFETDIDDANKSKSMLENRSFTKRSWIYPSAVFFKLLSFINLLFSFAH